MKTISYKVTYSLKDSYTRYEGSGSADRGTWEQGSESYECSGYNTVKIDIVACTGKSVYSSTKQWDYAVTYPNGTSIIMPSNEEYKLADMYCDYRKCGHRIFATYDGTRLTFRIQTYKQSSDSGSAYSITSFSCNLEFFTQL